MPTGLPRSKRARSRGQSLVEFALLAPILLFLFAMAADFGRLFYAYVAVENAAKEGAAYGATNPICVDDSREICSGTNNVESRVSLEAGSLPGGIAATLVRCLDGSFVDSDVPRVPIDDCTDGDTYVVRAQHTFALITPVLGQILGNSIVLESEARARVLNVAFDPAPGAYVGKEACAGAGCTDFVLTPFADAENNLVYLEVDPGETIGYRITVRNIGGETLTSSTIADSHGPLPSACLATWSSTLPVGATWTCEYSLQAPTTSGQAVVDFANTVTVDAAQIDPRQGTATVKVIAPAHLAITKDVHIYERGGSGAGPEFGSQDDWTAHFNNRIDDVEMWYRIRVVNDGGRDATGFGISDTGGPLPSAFCPEPPSVLAPGDAYSCRYPRTYGSLAPSESPYTEVETTTASADGDLVASATTTVTLRTCGDATDLVVPKLVDLTKPDASATWTDAGFTGAFDAWAGDEDATVGTQSLDAYSCAAPDSAITVTR